MSLEAASPNDIAIAIKNSNEGVMEGAPDSAFERSNADKKLALELQPQGKRTPVLIIPGFMSSGLECIESKNKSYVGKRVWLNIAQLGFHSYTTFGTAQKESSSKEYKEAMSCKNSWYSLMQPHDASPSTHTCFRGTHK